MARGIRCPKVVVLDKQRSASSSYVTCVHVELINILNPEQMHLEQMTGRPELTRPYALRYKSNISIKDSLAPTFWTKSRFKNLMLLSQLLPFVAWLEKANCMYVHIYCQYRNVWTSPFLSVWRKNYSFFISCNFSGRNYETTSSLKMHL